MKRSRHAICSVVGCRASQVTLHRIPASEETKAKWLDFVFKGNVPETVGKNVLVCAKHFSPDFYTNLGQYEAGLASKLYLIDGAAPSIRLTDANTHEDLPRVHHVACQTDPPKVSTVATQLSITRPHYRSTGIQATMQCPDVVGVGTSESHLSSTPIKMPRLELKEEEEDHESHWVLQMIV